MAAGSDMTDKGLFTVTQSGLVPWERDERSGEMLRELLNREVQKPVYVSLRTPRNPEFSAMAHVVFSKLADGLGVPMDAVKQFLKEETGRYDVVNVKGHPQKIHHSVSFGAMSEEKFRAFWNDALPIILEKLLGGVRSKEYQEIVDILAGKPRKKNR